MALTRSRELKTFYIKTNRSIQCNIRSTCLGRSGLRLSWGLFINSILGLDRSVKGIM